MLSDGILKSLATPQNHEATEWCDCTEKCKYVYFIGIVSMYYCMDFRRATKADEGEFTLPVSS